MKKNINVIITKKNKKGNVIYIKWSDDGEDWYNDKGKLIHRKFSDGPEGWWNDNDNLTHVKCSNGTEYWWNDKNEEVTNELQILMMKKELNDSPKSKDSGILSKFI